MGTNLEALGVLFVAIIVMSIIVSIVATWITVCENNEFLREILQELDSALKNNMKELLS